LLKPPTTPCAREVVDDACNVFGHCGVTRGGMAIVVEQLHHTYEFDAILGGEEKILSDIRRLTGPQADAQGKDVERVSSLCILNSPT
jgi:hypothetical protein